MQNKTDQLLKLLEMLKDNPIIINGDKRELFENISVIKSDLLHIKEKLCDLRCNDCFDKINAVDLKIVQTETKIEHVKSWMFITFLSTLVSLGSIVSIVILYTKFVKGL